MATLAPRGTNAKKIVEVEMSERHAAARRNGGRRHSRRSLQGHILGRINPVIKFFTTLFGLLAVELAVQLTAARAPT